MKTKQTAVEWLIDWLMDNPITSDGYVEAMMKAKQMETEQIKQAHNTGFVDAHDWPHKRNADQYYEETYGK